MKRQNNTYESGTVSTFDIHVLRTALSCLPMKPMAGSRA